MLGEPLPGVLGVSPRLPFIKMLFSLTNLKKRSTRDGNSSKAVKSRRGNSIIRNQRVIDKVCA